MDNTQKGILISSDSLTWKQLEFGYSVTRELVGDLAAADIDYVYVAERGNDGGYFTGHVGRIRKITITPATNSDNRIYSFELSKLLKPSISTGQLQFEVRGKKTGRSSIGILRRYLQTRKHLKNPLKNYMRILRRLACRRYRSVRQQLGSQIRMESILGKSRSLLRVNAQQKAPQGFA